MAKKIFLFLGVLIWFVSASAEEVVRLIPLAGTAQDVPVASLQKIVFTTDSIVFVRKASNSLQPSVLSPQASNPEPPDAVYKYDYSAMLFVPAEPQSIESTIVPEQSRSTKFIRDGRLYIRHDNTIYDVLGTPKTIQN